MKDIKYEVVGGKVVNREVKLCDCCHIEKDNMTELHTNDFDGFAYSSSTIHICQDCIEENEYFNDFGFTFIKVKDKYSNEKLLYVKSPREFNYERVRNKKQIERAFNPDYYDFMEWESK